LTAIWSCTVSELLREVFDMGEECRLKQEFELLRRQESLEYRDWDWDTTVVFVTHTRQRENLGVRRRGKEVQNTCCAVAVTTS
jgi:hypothetical protein